MRALLPFALVLAAASARAQPYEWADLTPTSAAPCRAVAPSRSPSGARVLYAACAPGLLRSDDDGATWAVVRRGVVRFAAAYRDAGRVYAGTRDTLFATTDGGRTWRSLNDAFRNIWGGYRLWDTTRWETSPFDADRLMIVLSRTASLVATTVDGGRTFRTLSFPYDSHHGNILNAVPSSKDPDRLVVHAHQYDPRYPPGSNLLIPTGGWGTAYGPLVEGPVQPCEERECLLTDTTGAVYLSYGSRRTRDGGRSYAPVTSGATALSVVATSSENAVAFAHGGPYGGRSLYLSGDDGATWRRVGRAGPSDAGWRHLDPRDSTLYVANGAGLFVLRRVTETAADEPASPLALVLGVYPNPALGPVTIRFALDRPGPVRLTVHDALGRAVAVLADGALAAGAHAATLDVTLAPGVYLVRLSAGGRSVTRPLTVVR